MNVAPRMKDAKHINTGTHQECLIEHGIAPERKTPQTLRQLLSCPPDLGMSGQNAEHLV